MYLCVRSIDVASFYYFTIKYKMFLSLVFFLVFHFIIVSNKTNVTDYVLVNKANVEEKSNKMIVETEPQVIQLSHIHKITHFHGLELAFQ
jgi:hypothetical protein